MADTWISDDMRAAVGAELGGVVSMPVSASDIRRWAQAVYWPEPPPRRYWDEEYAAATPAGGLVAPEEFNAFAWMTAEGPLPAERRTEPGGGPERALGIDPPATQFMLNGGVEYTYTGVPIRPGDVLTSTTRLADYSERDGRLGRMLFTTTETELRNQHGELVKTSAMTLIRY